IEPKPDNKINYLRRQILELEQVLRLEEEDFERRFQALAKAQAEINKDFSQPLTSIGVPIDNMALPKRHISPKAPDSAIQKCSICGMKLDKSDDEISPKDRASIVTVHAICHTCSFRLWDEEIVSLLAPRLFKCDGHGPLQLLNPLGDDPFRWNKVPGHNGGRETLRHLQERAKYLHKELALNCKRHQAKVQWLIPHNAKECSDMVEVRNKILSAAS
ncbi:hypothetical protein DXG01_008696, partial [Tephrocybe rancida]